MITPQQIRGARAMLGLTQAELAERAGISKTGLNNIEGGATDPKASTLKTIRAALEAAGAIFVAENGEGPGVRLKKLRAFLLRPIDSTEDAWKSSTFRAALWVLASSEEEARRHAGSEFYAGDVLKSGHMGSPWLLPHLTACEEKPCPFDLKGGIFLDESGQEVT